MLAAAHETGLITTMQTAISSAAPTTHLGRMGQATLRAMLLTLLFLPVVGLRRTWDLRSYSGDALALLTGRGWAYGYRHVERFLAGIAHAGAADGLTTALARWTTQIWHADAPESPTPSYYYIDGHRKPVYADTRIPRGLIGRTGVIEGCRALVLLHDSHGHPLLATTHRGDQHLTIGLPHILARYAAAIGERRIAHVVVDREGMGGDFLAGLVASGCTIVTILRADQYDGLSSFTEVGAFVPLVRDRHGIVVREVAPACFALPIPRRPGEHLALRVALIRDLRCQVPEPDAAVPSPEDDCDDPDWLPSHQRWLAGLAPEERDWWTPDWVATPVPTAPTQAKLIPIVTTADTCDPVALAEVYTARWPQQENIIRDFLIPLGIDTNHGYAKTLVENSEVATRRTTLEQRRDRLSRWAARARTRYQQATRRADRRYTQDKKEGDQRYRELNTQQTRLHEQGEERSVVHRIIRERKGEIDAERDIVKAQ